MEQNKNHTMQIEHGQGFLATSVGEVITFNEKEIRLRLKTGEKLCVMGANFKINAFNKQNGEIRVVGVVESVKYLNSTKQKLRKLFG